MIPKETRGGKRKGAGSKKLPYKKGYLKGSFPVALHGELLAYCTKKSEIWIKKFNQLNS